MDMLNGFDYARFGVGSKVVFRYRGRDEFPPTNRQHPLRKFHGKLCVVRALGAATTSKMGEPTYYIGLPGEPTDAMSDCIVYQNELTCPVEVRDAYVIRTYEYKTPTGSVYTAAIWFGDEKAYSTLGYDTEVTALKHAAWWLNNKLNSMVEEV